MGCKTWQPLPPLSDTDVNFIKNTRKKLRFLADENIDPCITKEIEHIKWINVKHLIDCNMAGVPDEKVFDFARKENRALLTHDKDFMNNQKYPLSLSPGIVFIPGDSGNAELCLRGLAWVCFTFKNLHNLLKGCKINVNPQEGQLDITQKTWDGKIDRTIYDLKSGCYMVDNF